MKVRGLTLVVFAVLAAAALSHDLLAPNGLGVVGGKARLLLAARGFPDGFFTDPRYAPYQPAYPPGAALLTVPLLALDDVWYRASDPEDRRLTRAPCAQLLIPLALTGLFAFALRRTQGGGVAVATLLALAPLTLRLASGFYTEPLAALGLALGLHRARKAPFVGALLAGSAGLFRSEGALLAPLLVLTRPAPHGWRRFLHLLAALLPGLAWQLYARRCGADFGDFDFTVPPSWSRVGWTLKRLVAVAANPLGTGGLAYWFVLRSGWRERGVAISALVLGAVLLAFNRTPHYGWVVANTLPRYLWLTLVPLLATRRQG